MSPPSESASIPGIKYLGDKTTNRTLLSLSTICGSCDSSYATASTICGSIDGEKIKSSISTMRRASNRFRKIVGEGPLEALCRDHLEALCRDHHKARLESLKQLEAPYGYVLMARTRSY